MPSSEKAQDEKKYIYRTLRDIYGYPRRYLGEDMDLKWKSKRCKIVNRV